MSKPPRRDPDPVVEAYKKDIDRTLFRENLKLSVEDRFRKAMAHMRLAEELRAKRAAGRPKDLAALAELEAIEEDGA